MNAPRKNIPTVLALIADSPFVAIAAHNSTLKFYDAISSGIKNLSTLLGCRKQEPPSSREDRILWWKRAGVATLSVLLAGCYTGKIYDLAIQEPLRTNSDRDILLAATSVTLFSQVFWSVDESLMSYVKTGDPQSMALGFLSTIGRNLSSMADSAVKSLRWIFKDLASKPVIFIEEKS